MHTPGRIADIFPFILLLLLGTVLNIATGHHICKDEFNNTVAWTQWTACSVTCGEGMRSKSCPYHGVTEYEKCTQDGCPSHAGSGDPSAGRRAADGTWHTTKIIVLAVFVVIIIISLLTFGAYAVYEHGLCLGVGHSEKSEVRLKISTHSGNETPAQDRGPSKAAVALQMPSDEDDAGSTSSYEVHARSMPSYEAHAGSTPAYEVQERSTPSYEDLPGSTLLYEAHARSPAAYEVHAEAQAGSAVANNEIRTSSDMDTQSIQSRQSDSNSPSPSDSQSLLSEIIYAKPPGVLNSQSEQSDLTLQFQQSDLNSQSQLQGVFLRSEQSSVDSGQSEESSFVSSQPDKQSQQSLPEPSQSDTSQPEEPKPHVTFRVKPGSDSPDVSTSSWTPHFKPAIKRRSKSGATDVMTLSKISQEPAEDISSTSVVQGQSETLSPGGRSVAFLEPSVTQEDLKERSGRSRMHAFTNMFRGVKGFQAEQQHRDQPRAYPGAQPQTPQGRRRMPQMPRTFKNLFRGFKSEQPPNVVARGKASTAVDVSRPSKMPTSSRPSRASSSSVSSTSSRQKELQGILKNWRQHSSPVDFVPVLDEYTVTMAKVDNV